jgi:TATA-binding protein-associated factor
MAYYVMVYSSFDLSDFLDMGLGKTLQTICIIASDHYLRAERYKVTQSPEDRPLPSLVVCPPTITGHWQQEISTYAPFVKALVYVGSPADRQRLRSLIPHQDIVITSYDICRNDTDLICKYNYNYCTLDEGHIIKNAKAKVTLAVKRVMANHRLILSGTPVQNNVLELWSLFDFLMPGFLGTEKFFHEKFAKPIAASRDSKSSSKEQEAGILTHATSTDSTGALALEGLHKQVLPFLLRRMKEDVLADLPPKIIQDYYCELSPLQKRLYEDFAKQQAQEVTGDVESTEGKQHIFKALQYMRKLCNHPGLVLQPKHPKYAEITAELKKEGSSVWDVKNAPKLAALTELLIDCGITGGVLGAKSEVEVLTSGAGIVSQHRALIFCQVREMIDRIEKDVLKAKLPGVTYLRLDGSVDAKDRFGIVEKFNADPTIDLLLLTTHVGGLGLNLTGADTVIFVEHDWNPMKDLQAMDRAHRLGQKRVVNVYRLITKNTLEEKIMGYEI